MYFYLRSQCLMSTFVVIRLFYSVSSCPYGKEGLVGDKICNSPWLMNQLVTVERVRTATGRKQCWFCLYWSFTTTFFGVLRCFGVFWTISDIVFKADILPTNDFFERQVSCASPTNPFLGQLQCRSDIEYEYWKWSALRYITSLPCKTKPRVGKLSKSRCNPCWTSKNGWYKDLKLLVHACMVGLKKLPVKQVILLLWPFLCWMVLWLVIYPKFALACHFCPVISWFIACTLRTKVIGKVLE